MSALYRCRVVHVRPGKHRLAYRTLMLLLSLDELPATGARLRLLGHNRPALFSVYDRDHGAGVDAPLRPQIAAKLREAGVAADDGRILLLTMPRVLGYVFNPLSVYFCHRKDDALAAVVYEVSNTFGERHFYVLPAEAAHPAGVRQTCEKSFFVSPFLEMGLRYEFRAQSPGDALRLSIIVRREGDVALAASVSGARRALSDHALLRVFVSDPLVTFKVIAAIHWEAFKMWVKGVRYIGRHGVEAQPRRNVSRAASHSLRAP